jgi:putative flippase GtrA
MSEALVKKLLAFGCVGAVGFIVDAGILSLLAQKLGVNVYLARVTSFLAAVFVTWLLNRTWVFKTTKGQAGGKKREYISYFAVQSVGALLNLGVFATLVASHAALRAYPVVPLAAGSIVGMFFNYAGAHFWVFKNR